MKVTADFMVGPIVKVVNNNEYYVLSEVSDEEKLWL